MIFKFLSSAGEKIKKLFYKTWSAKKLHITKKIQAEGMAKASLGNKITSLFRKKPEPIKRKYFTQAIKNQVRRVQRGKCAHCKRWEHYRYCEFDHIKGRNDNSITNCQMLCLKCHNEKTRQDKIKLTISKRNAKKKKPIKRKVARRK